MESSPNNSGLESWFERCSELCSSLTSQGCKFNFSLKLEGSFSFSLQSENAVHPRTKKRSSPSYMRRQQRRKADLLKKRSRLSPGENSSEFSPPAEKAAGNHQEEAAAVDTSSPLNLCPKPIYPRISTGSVETEDDYDEIQEWAAGGTVTEKSVSASHSVHLFGPETEEKGQIAGSEDQMGPPVAPRRSPEEPEGDQWTSVTYKRQSPRSANVPVSPVRQIPASHSTWAKPLLTDCRHSIWSDKSGSEMIVFAPPEVSYDDVIKAMKTPIDWRYFRPTSHRYDKWVYYPMENAENV